MFWDEEHFGVGEDYQMGEVDRMEESYGVEAFWGKGENHYSILCYTNRMHDMVVVSAVTNQLY